MNFENHYHQVTLLVSKADENTQKICTASMILLTFVANLDKKVTGGEISHMKYYLHKNFKVEKIHLNHAISDYLFVHESGEDKTKLSEARDYLKQHMTEAQKKDYFMILLKIAASDQDLDDTEKKYVKNIALGMGVDDYTVNQEIISSDLGLIVALDEELKKDPSFCQHEKLQFVSIAEMLEDLKKQGSR